MYLINNEILKSNLIALILETGRLILTSLNLPLTYRYQDEFYRYVSIIPFYLSFQKSHQNHLELKPIQCKDLILQCNVRKHVLHLAVHTAR